MRGWRNLLGWLSDYRRDVASYTGASGTSALRQLLFAQGLWALLQYRIAHAIFKSSTPLKTIPLFLMSIWRKVVEITTGISISHDACIGPGLYIGHFGNIIIGSGVVMGEGCTISQGVTIGLSGDGYPTLADEVYIATNAVVAGAISVGRGARVSACSLVLDDVPAYTTVRGVPAVVISRKNTA